MEGVFILGGLILNPLPPPMDKKEAEIEVKIKIKTNRWALSVKEEVRLQFNVND